jgi:DNA-binding NarL/FixJ family response regulator
VDLSWTPTDQAVLNFAEQGCSNKEIASQLSISPRTVKEID